jgi:hypothetical protein
MITHRWKKHKKFVAEVSPPFHVPIITQAGPHVFYSTADKQNVGQFVSGDSPQKGRHFRAALLLRG